MGRTGVPRGYAGVDFEGFWGAVLVAAAICLGARYDCPSSTRQYAL